MVYLVVVYLVVVYLVVVYLLRGLLGVIREMHTFARRIAYDLTLITVARLEP